MEMLERYVNLRFHLDTNLINAKQKLPLINRLEKWWGDEVIELGMSETAQDEACADGNPRRIKKTIGPTFTETCATTSQERADLQLIAKIVFPLSSLTPNQQRDVEIIFNAKKYHYILVTNDGASRSQPRGILGSREDLRKQFGTKVVTPQEAVDMVIMAIQKRDDNARRRAQLAGLQLPPWVGQDF